MDETPAMARHAVIHVRTAHMFQRDVGHAVQLEQDNKVPASRAMGKFHDKPFSEDSVRAPRSMTVL